MLTLAATLALSAALAGGPDLFPHRMTPGKVGAFGDFNGDGLMDRLAPNDSTGIDFHIGDGAGHFTAGNRVPMSAWTARQLVADVNGDGIDDSIVEFGPPFGVPPFGVVLGSASGILSGTAQPPGGNLVGFCLGDFNGDGSVDVLGTDQTDLLTFAGNGAGGFTKTTTKPANANGHLGDGLGADLDLDGDDDALFTRYAFAPPYSMVAVENHGGGSLVTSQLTTGLLFFGQEVRELADFDADGRVDALVGDSYSFAHELLLNTSVGPGIAFAPQANLVAGLVSPGVTGALYQGIADFDLDGRPDLAFKTPTSHAFELFAWRSAATPIGFAPYAQAVVGNSLGRVCDLDADGLVDFIGDNKGGLRSVVLRDVLTADPDAAILSTGPGAVSAIGCADVDLDGDIDVAIGSYPSTSAMLSLNVGGMLTPKTAVATMTGSPTRFRPADLDSDGNPDFIVRTKSSLVGLRGDGHGAFTALPQVVTSFGTGVVPGCMAIDDLNLDGVVDVCTPAFVSPSKYDAAVCLGSPTGFTKTATLSTGSWTPGVAIGDVTGDGILDIVASQSQFDGVPGVVWVYVGGPAGTFASSFTTPAGTKPTGVACGDFNDDGKADVAVVSAYDDAIALLRSTGGALVPYATIPFEQQYFDLATIDAIDLTQDGWLDLVVHDDQDGAIAVFAGAHDGTFAALGEYASMAEAIDVVDFDQDGRLDLVSAGNYEEIAVLHGQAGALGVEVYGAGKPGTLGVPTLGVLGAPALGASFGLRIDGGLAGALPIVLFGAQRAALPFDDGMLNVLPLATVPLVPFPPNGRLDMPVVVPASPMLRGFTIDLQVMFVDSIAAGYLHTAQTKGLEIVLGN